METNNSYCIYCHIVPNDKKYYGYTSQKPEHRWGKNGRGYKNNIDFYNDIIFYGWDSIEHIVIAKGLTKDEAEWIEEELIRTNRAYDSEYGYNKDIGNKRTDKTKDRISEAHKGKYLTDETKAKISKANSGSNNHKARKVICITTMTVFDTITEAADYYGINNGDICSCCKGKYKSAGKLSDGTKLVWKYIDIIKL